MVTEPEARALLARHLRVLATAVNVSDWPAYIRSVAAAHERGEAWLDLPEGPADHPADSAREHLDAVADTGDAYTSFRGYVLTCLWCPTSVRRWTKAEALAKLQQHYDDVTGGRAGRLR